MNYSLKPPNRSQQETPCPICGKQNYIWGRTVGESPSVWVYFRAKQASWGEGQNLWARKCCDCSNVQLFSQLESS